MFRTPKKFHRIIFYSGIGVGKKNRNYVYTIREPSVFTPFNCRGNKVLLSLR